MILICYDGSADSRAAIDHAGRLLNEHPAIVLTVWQPFLNVISHMPAGFGLAPTMADPQEIDKTTQDNAARRAEEGAQLARDGGLNAQARTRAQSSSVAEAILAEADEAGADAVVLGSRGLTGIRSLLLGSVSHSVIQNADVTVIVVPSPEVASARTHERRRRERGTE